MTMEKYIITRPWNQGQKVGDIFETKSLHPSLVTHVTQVGLNQDNDEKLDEKGQKKLEKAEAAVKALTEKLSAVELELKAKNDELESEKARADKAEAELKALQEEANKPQGKAEGEQAEPEKKGK